MLLPLELLLNDYHATEKIADLPRALDRRMAQDIHTGSRTASGFDDALGLQRLIDAIEKSDRSGSRVTLAPSNRTVPLPE
jgi:hypothetical protein